MESILWTIEFDMGHQWYENVNTFLNGTYLNCHNINRIDSPDLPVNLYLLFNFNQY